MEIAFTKMHGAGNDFVMIENLDGSLSLTPEQIAYLCDRRFGIGADGLILLSPSEQEDLDATFVYYNADGGRAEMCGNGARCFTRFAIGNGIGTENGLSFMTDAGPMQAKAANGEFTIQMTPVHSIETNARLTAEGREYEYHFLNTGVPHVVVFVKDIDAVDIEKEGRSIRIHENFQPSGANVNFAQVDPDGLIRARTYERGVEDETLACGTGVVAIALAANLAQERPTPLSVLVKGGDILRVDFDRNADKIESITLTGPAKTVYSGKIDL